MMDNIPKQLGSNIIIKYLKIYFLLRVTLTVKKWQAFGMTMAWNTEQKREKKNFLSKQQKAACNS